FIFERVLSIVPEISVSYFQAGPNWTTPLSVAIQARSAGKCVTYVKTHSPARRACILAISAKVALFNEARNEPRRCRHQTESKGSRQEPLTALESVREFTPDFAVMFLRFSGTNSDVPRSSFSAAIPDTNASPPRPAVRFAAMGGVGLLTLTGHVLLFRDIISMALAMFV
ncbi:MAG: hypothetical protein KDA89_23090, partial [Planctomycetaceae bacterium]|nr:hypothetical protein [Planctomycetaceae bacterium]